MKHLYLTNIQEHVNNGIASQACKDRAVPFARQLVYSLTHLRMKRYIILYLVLCMAPVSQAQDVIDLIQKVNDQWQTSRPEPDNAFWHSAAYHTGNMAAYEVTGEERYRKYSETWAEQNEWKGAKSDDRANWKYRYGETGEHVLFGDWQACFQTYIDLYSLQPYERKIAIRVKPEEGAVRAGDIAYIAIELVGENGVVECNTDTKIAVSVEGGKLLSFGSANPRTPESYIGGSFTTYYGRALAVARADKAGIMRIMAWGGDLEAAWVEINVTE